MGILSRLRDTGENFIAKRLQGEALSLSVEIPGSDGPLWQLKLNAQSEPLADGEQVRMRAHWRLRLRRPAAALPHSGRPRRGLPARVGRWIEKRLESPLLQALAEPLLDREIHSWIELRSSNAALDEGSRALVPEQLHALGLRIRDDAPVQSWAGETPGPRPGFATLTLFQIDKSQLPPSVQKAFGDKPFQMSAALANVIEEM
jgi:hypothetical protein